MVSIRGESPKRVTGAQIGIIENVFTKSIKYNRYNFTQTFVFISESDPPSKRSWGGFNQSNEQSGSSEESKEPKIHVFEIISREHLNSPRYTNSRDMVFDHSNYFFD